MSFIASLRLALIAALVTPLLLLHAITVRADVIGDAMSSWHAGDARTAMILLRDHLERHGSDAAARLLLGRVYLDQSAGAAAEQTLQRASRDGGFAAADHQVELAEARLLQGKFTQIVEDPATLAASDPADRAQLHAIRGEAYLALGQQEQADTEFHMALGFVPNHARTLLGQAKLALTQGNKERAREFLNQAVALHPQDARVLESLGEVQFGDGQFGEADAAFTQAIAYGRSDWMAQYKRAMTRLELGQLDQAAADIAAAAKQSPNFPGLSYARGILLLKQEQPEQALADLLLYLRERPKDPQAAYLAGTALYQLGRYHESEEYLERAYRAAPATPTRAAALAAVRLANQDFAGAEAVLRPLADQPDAPPGIQELLGQAVRGQGRAAEARDLLTTAVTASPDGAITRLRLAEAMLAAGDPVGAEPELRAVLQASPGNQIARLMLIRIYLEKPDPKAALTEAESLIAIAPKDPRALNALGLAHQVNGDPAAARGAFARALESERGFADAAFNLVAAARREPDPQVAGALCEQVLAAQPGHTNALLLLAQLEVTAGRRTAALERLSEALAKDAGNLALRLNLARGYLAAGAIPAAQRILKDRPQSAAADPTFLMVQAQAELAAGQTREAVQTLETLIQLQPDSAPAHFLLAAAYAAGNRVLEMQWQLLEGYRIDPQSPLAAETLDRVAAALPDSPFKNLLVSTLRNQTADGAAILLLQARLAFAAERYPEALRLFGDLVQARPDDRALFMEFLNAQVKADELFPASQAAQAWVGAHPDDHEARGLLAQIDARRGRVAQALQTYRELLREDPKNAKYNNNLAMLLIDREPAEAVTYARAAAAAAPQDPAVADTLGLALLAAGDTRGAVQALAKAYAALPTEPTVAFHYARALAADGDPAQARTVLLTITDLAFPEQGQAQELLRQLAP